MLNNHAKKNNLQLNIYGIIFSGNINENAMDE
jgi:hypothetical protein